MKTKILSTILIALLTLPAMAYDYEENGIRYTIDNSTKSASVTRYNSSVIAQNEGVVNIPEAISFNGRTYSVTSIGYYAFGGCTHLTSITIPSSVTSISSEAFRGCTGLTSITIPSSVTSISSNAFYGCTGLTSVNITDIAAWCKIYFDYYFGSIDPISSNPLYYAKHLYLNGEEVTELTIPNSVTSIGNYAFVGCTGLTSITIPNSVTSIGERTFYNCTGLTSITIPSSVTSIYRSAFYGCTGLTSITIPSSVTSIENYAFSGCTGLTSIYSFAVKPPSIDSNTFDADVVKTKATLYVLPEAISAYQSDTYWKQFWIEEMDESMTGIENVKISSEENALIYDLYGKRIIGKPQGGQIYIRNGKKTIAM